jgi:hypothetical protein
MQRQHAHAQHATEDLQHAAKPNVQNAQRADTRQRTPCDLQSAAGTGHICPSGTKKQTIKQTNKQLNKQTNN